YVTDTKTCKNTKLLAYFGETTPEDCGICSVCIERKRRKSTKKKPKSIRKYIVEVLENENLHSNQIIEKSDFHSEEILETLRDMLAHGFVGLTASNEYYLKKRT